MAKSVIKTRNRGELISDLTIKLANHAEAIGELRSAIEGVRQLFLKRIQNLESDAGVHAHRVGHLTATVDATASAIERIVAAAAANGELVADLIVISDATTRAIQREHDERTGEDEKTLQQFEALHGSIATRLRMAAILRRANTRSIDELEKMVDYLRRPWWYRAWLRMKGETPWSKREKSSSKKDAKGSAAPIGEVSLTSSLGAAPDGSCTKSSPSSPTTPRKHPVISSGGGPLKKSLPNKRRKTSACDSENPEGSPKETAPSGGGETPTGS